MAKVHHIYTSFDKRLVLINDISSTDVFHFSYRYPEIFVDREKIRAMQSQLQTVINNSLSSSIALTGILPHMQSAAVTTNRSGNSGGHESARGSKEGYYRQDIRELKRTTAFEQSKAMF